MTPAVTAGLLHDLVTRSHAEGITALGVEAAIEHDDRILLIAEPGPDFTDGTWQLPGGPVLPGQTLTDALHPAVAAIGLTIDEITGYLGHHDHPGAHATTRVFCFTVTVTDPRRSAAPLCTGIAGPTPATCQTRSIRRPGDGPPPGQAVLRANR
jgi:ADP-ribose pyrophosphatase YjhB (NUDIX family)